METPPSSVREKTMRTTVPKTFIAAKNDYFALVKYPDAHNDNLFFWMLVTDVYETDVDSLVELELASKGCYPVVQVRDGGARVKFKSVNGNQIVRHFGKEDARANKEAGENVRNLAQNLVNSQEVRLDRLSETYTITRSMRMKLHAAEMFKKGLAPDVVSDALNLSRTTTTMWLASYKEGGMKQLAGYTLEKAEDGEVIDYLIDSKLVKTYKDGYVAVKIPGDKTHVLLDELDTAPTDYDFVTQIQFSTAGLYDTVKPAQGGKLVPTGTSVDGGMLKALYSSQNTWGHAQIEIRRQKEASEKAAKERRKAVRERAKEKPEGATTYLINDNLVTPYGGAKVVVKVPGKRLHIVMNKDDVRPSATDHLYEMRFESDKSYETGHLAKSGELTNERGRISGAEIAELFRAQNESSLLSLEQKRAKEGKKKARG
jgi:hypothetical protein